MKLKTMTKINNLQKLNIQYETVGSEIGIGQWHRINIMSFENALTMKKRDEDELTTNDIENED